jgi:hypothetical protein
MPTPSRTKLLEEPQLLLWLLASLWRLLHGTARHCLLRSSEASATTRPALLTRPQVLEEQQRRDRNLRREGGGYAH